MLQTLKELEQAFRTLERFRRRRKVTVFGSARTRIDHGLYALARELGSALARRDMMVITGGGAGIMGAAHEGAGPEASLGFNITLPFEQRANPTIEGTDHLLSFHFFYVRKLFFLKEADALVLCPGGFGTLDETFEVLTLIQTGKSPLVPLVLLDTPDGHFWDDTLAYLQRNLLEEGYILPADLKLVRLVRSPEAAAAEIEHFYGNYHSTRRRDGLLHIPPQARPDTGPVLSAWQRISATSAGPGLHPAGARGRPARRSGIRPSDAPRLRLPWPSLRSSARTGGRTQSAGALGSHVGWR